LPPPPSYEPDCEAPQSDKTFEDLAADAICATAKGGWYVTKKAAPIVGRIAGKVLLRAAPIAGNVIVRSAKAVSETRTKWLGEHPKPVRPWSGIGGCCSII
jgi:hypothetical protein